MCPEIVGGLDLCVPLTHEFGCMASTINTANIQDSHTALFILCVRITSCTMNIKGLNVHVKQDSCTPSYSYKLILVLLQQSNVCS